MGQCRICLNDKNNQEFQIREMMFGTKKFFEYIKCSECGCMQIKTIPGNLEQYYPLDYKYFKITYPKKQNKFKTNIKKSLSRYCITGRFTFTGYLLNKIFSAGYIEKLQGLDLDLNSHILDVGSGIGNTLKLLSEYGFSELTGIDPYIEKDFIHDNFKIYKKSIDKVSEQYDFVILNYVFEHIPEPLQMLKDISRILKPGRFAMIRIPVIDCYAWRKYKENLVSLEAPRHLYIHSEKSIELLAEMAEFTLKNVVYDSSDFQFWASEQIMNNIPLMNQSDKFIKPHKELFSEKQLQAYKQKASELNQNNDGNSAIFYLHKSESIK